MHKFKYLVLLIRDIAKTIYFNFKIFPVSVALKLPVRIKYNVKLGKLKRGSIIINSCIGNFMIKLGYGGANFINTNDSSLTISNGGKLVFNGKCTLAEGFNIFINGGTLEIGDRLYSNKNIEIQCEEKIMIGESVLIGWNVSIRDTDGHKTYYLGKENNEKDVVSIRDNVWIASNCTILKGTHISSHSIIGCNSLVCGIKINEPECLVAGIPAKIKKRNITWKE